MGNHHSAPARPTRVCASQGAWIEGEAVRQLDAVARLAGVVAAAGMPDLHPGRGWPVGAAFLSQGWLYPATIGSDVGCGMALWTTSLRRSRVRPAKLAACLEGLDRPWEMDRIEEALRAAEIPSGPFDLSLGTVGGGNHFLELLRVGEVFDGPGFAQQGLDPDLLVLLVHTGSRGLGGEFFRRHAERFGASPLAAESDEGVDWLKTQQHALAWAATNRAACATRALEALGAEGIPVLDAPHNFIEGWSGAAPDWAGGGVVERGFLHRKGAARAVGATVLPGSRGDLTFLMEGGANPTTLLSTAHGAGRKISRGEAKEKLQGRLSKKELTRTRFGGVVVCGDDQLLWEEAPECYRKASAVAEEVEACGAARRIAAFEPVTTFKTSSKAERGMDRDSGRGRRRLPPCC